MITLVPLAQDAGIGSTHAAGLISVLATAGFIGNLLLAWIADRVDRMRLLGSLFIAVALVNGLLFFSHDYPLLVTCAALLGLTAGIVSPAFHTLIADRFGPASFGTAYGLMTPDSRHHGRPLRALCRRGVRPDGRVRLPVPELHRVAGVRGAADVRHRDADDAPGRRASAATSTPLVSGTYPPRRPRAGCGRSHRNRRRRVDDCAADVGLGIADAPHRIDRERARHPGSVRRIAAKPPGRSR